MWPRSDSFLGHTKIYFPKNCSWSCCSRRVWHILLYFVLNGRLVNSKTFESLKLLDKEREKPLSFERNWKQKNAKIAWIAWHDNVLTEMFTITK